MAVEYVILALLYIVLSGSATTECYVRSKTSTTCPTEPCLTLSDYVNNKTKYFTSDTSFIFLEGEHYLNAPLVLYSVSNITLSGIDTRVRIIISAEANVSYTNSLAITLSSLEIVYYGEELSSSALLFNNSYSVQIVNVKFTGLNSGRDHSRALSYTQTTSHITNCSFFNGHSDYGGAINVYFSNITFSGGNSYTNNTADISGGALFANNSILIFSGVNSFLRNKASTVNTSGNYTIGGGAIFTSQTVIELNGFNNFTENGPINASQYILLGGALMIRYNSYLSVQGNAIFNNNSGDSGGAVFLLDSTLSLSGKMDFTNNRAPYALGGGAIYSYSSTMHYQGDIHFANNQAVAGGAIYIERSLLNFQENVTFSYNAAIRNGGGGVYVVDSTVAVSGRIGYLENTAIGGGGGMGFEGTMTQLILQSPVTMNFYRNRASGGGGLFFHDSNAMYTAQCQDSAVESIPCFFKVEAADLSSMDIHLSFVENHAEAGTVLYGGALQLCQVQVGAQLHTNGFLFFQNISTFVLSEDRSSYISSGALKVCFCNNEEADCSEVSKTVHVKRGELFNVSVITVGQLNMPVPSALIAITNNDDGFTELNPPNQIMNDGICSDVGFRLLTKDGYKHLNLFPGGPCGGISNIVHYVDIELDPCPPGFDLVVNQCKCEKRLLNSNCDIDTGLIERPGNSWIKPILENQSYHGFILHKNCPLNFCKPPQETVFLDLSTDINDDQCTESRTGTLCGACKDGYSLTLNNFHCKICGNGYISLLLFFGFAGIALITILLALHMTVAAGTINGLILYTNIVSIYGDIFFPPDKTTVNPLTLFISWINLDFGIPTCFYDGLDAYAYAWFQFAFPFYLWFLICLIIFTNKISVKVGKLFGSNPVAVLATVVLMSYIKLLRASLRVLSYTHLEYPNGTRKIVWLLDANITYFDGKHIILVIVAICVIIFFLLPYIFLMMFGYQLQAYSGKKWFFWFNKFKPILDAYYAPYNNKTRYWTGFMLFVRGCLFLSFFLRPSTIELVAASLLFVAIAVIPWLSTRIYEKLYISILEASFILNFTILASTTYLVQTVHGNQVVVTYLFVGIAFVEFIGIVIFHLYLRIKSIKFFQNWKCIEHTKRTLMELKTKKSSNEIVNDKAAPTTTTCTFIDMREPLLEDS